MDLEAQETAEDAAVLKRYKILNLVGTGNYARVYKAINSNGREFAIKSINLNKTSDNYKQKFLPRELTILRKVSHISICKIFEILQISDRIFIVMQFCPKGTIADLLQKNGPMSENLTRYLFVPIVEAIVYLHSIDIAHRDIKVENILLDHDYAPKLTDFSYSICTNGSDRNQAPQSPPAAAATITTTTTTTTITNALAQPAAQSKTSSYNINSSNYNLRQPYRSFKTVDTGGVQRLRIQSLSRLLKLNETFCGTLPYLSPEMIRQHPYDSKKTDVWSLGICYYVMLNDRLPFPFDDIKQMVRKQLTKDYKFKANVEVGESCKHLMSLLLEPEFVKRPTSSDALKHPWMFGGPRDRPSGH